MSTQDTTQAGLGGAQFVDRQDQPVSRGGNRPRVRFRLGDEIPAVCGDADLMDILGIGSTAYCRRKKAGAFLPLLLPNPNGATTGATEYSGHLIACWLRGELASAKPQAVPVASVRKFFQSINRGRPKAMRTDARHSGQVGR